MGEEPGDEEAVLEHDVLECICEEDGGDYFGDREELVHFGHCDCF